nr:MAG TPA: hypothetical protein [Caudoviricetes sp.]
MWRQKGLRTQINEVFGITREKLHIYHGKR